MKSALKANLEKIEGIIYSARENVRDVEEIVKELEKFDPVQALVCNVMSEIEFETGFPAAYIPGEGFGLKLVKWGEEINYH